MRHLIIVTIGFEVSTRPVFQKRFLAGFCFAVEICDASELIVISEVVVVGLLLGA
jgi:hypothetical protein